MNSSRIDRSFRVSPDMARSEPPDVGANEHAIQPHIDAFEVAGAPTALSLALGEDARFGGEDRQALVERGTVFAIGGDATPYRFAVVDNDGSVKVLQGEDAAAMYFAGAPYWQPIDGLYTDGNSLVAVDDGGSVAIVDSELVKSMQWELASAEGYPHHLFDVDAGYTLRGAVFSDDAANLIVVSPMGEITVATPEQAVQIHIAADGATPLSTPSGEPVTLSDSSGMEGVPVYQRVNGAGMLQYGLYGTSFIELSPEQYRHVHTALGLR